MPIETVLEARERYLARALAADRATAERLARAYQGTLARLGELTARVNRDLRELADAGRLTAADVQRLTSYRDLMDILRIELGQFSRETGRLAQLVMQFQADAAVEGQRDMIEAQDAGIAAAFAQPDIRAVAEIDRILVRAQQPGGALDNIGEQTAQAVSDDVMTLIAQGQSPAFIARYLRRAFSLPFARGMTFVRTASAYASNEAAAAAQVENARLLRGWMWSSSRDARTCAACLARDGEIFPLGTTLNDHHAGRCVSIPVTRDDDWTGSYQRGRDWYAEQTAAEQAQLVGRGTRDLLAAGGTSWEAMPADYRNFTMGLMTRRQPLYALRALGPVERFQTVLRRLGDK